MRKFLSKIEEVTISARRKIDFSVSSKSLNYCTLIYQLNSFTLLLFVKNVILFKCWLYNKNQNEKLHQSKIIYK